jgi:DNA invertase Pin-like site-specific DNA recombinase
MTNSATKGSDLNESVRIKRAVIFTRTRSVPYDAERDQAQLKAQLRYCGQVAEELGAEVVRVYLAVGGAAQPHVSELIEQLLQTVERGGIDYVIVQHPDRLTRDPDKLIALADQIEAAGAHLVTGADRDGRMLGLAPLIRLIATAHERRTI